MTYRLGTGIAQIIPFHRIQLQQQQTKDEPIITNKLIITMLIVAIAKIAVLILWPI